MFGDCLTSNIGNCENQSELNIFIYELSKEEIGFSVAGFIKVNASFLGAVSFCRILI